MQNLVGSLDQRVACPGEYEVLSSENSESPQSLGFANYEMWRIGPEIEEFALLVTESDSIHGITYGPLRPIRSDS